MWVSALLFLISASGPAQGRSDAMRTDYPSAALREGREGTSYFTATVGADGRVRRCVITRSSGSADLDAETCRLFSRSARFKPALDKDGHPVEDTFSSKITWRLPH
jgi:protein TonB